MKRKEGFHDSAVSFRLDWKPVIYGADFKANEQGGDKKIVNACVRPAIALIESTQHKFLFRITTCYSTIQPWTTRDNKHDCFINDGKSVSANRRHVAGQRWSENTFLDERSTIGEFLAE